MATAISTPNGFDSEFDRGLGGGAGSACGARAGPAEGLVAPGKCGWSTGEETPAEGAARRRSSPGPGGCLQSAANTINKETLLPSHPYPCPKLGKIQDPGAINIVVIIIS